MGCTRNDHPHQTGILMDNIAHYIFRNAICRQNHMQTENMGFYHKTRSHLACMAGKKHEKNRFRGLGEHFIPINLVRKPKSNIFTASYSLFLMLSS